MSKELFNLMRAEEMPALYPSDFTKKEAIKTGVQFIQNACDEGNVEKTVLMSQIVRLKAVFDSMETELRSKLPREKITVNGCEFTPVEGGNTINYDEDPIYSQLKADLKAREELLKLAQKQYIIDAYGNDVPKVSTTPRKSSITIKF